MSEGKLYAVKNDEGKYCDCEHEKFLPLSDAYCPAIVSEDNAKAIVRDSGGHIVTFVEEPEKVVLTKEQAKIVDDAHEAIWPATYISGLEDSSEQRLLIEAFVNGYTVAKEKKYNVKVPHTKDVWYYKDSEAYLLTICPADKKLRGTFTEAEIEHYGLQDCEKEEVTDDGMGC
ncbi:DUF1642 domain-containing protein [Lacticaseibacillus paracasei]|uniref:DUF1642 domain-containing protein n=1 Tax=Lacticaseibacillus paracasei TaxID=1597 RepID=UPI0015FE0F51|nr:DUF1642 domain-containing protein [Lacticaseibacillus paracasei]MBB1166832.1 DUF1642 domain-containing protein [Lacticaseibacillus paracasei]